MYSSCIISTTTGALSALPPSTYQHLPASHHLFCAPALCLHQTLQAVYDALVPLRANLRETIDTLIDTDNTFNSLQI